MTSKQPDLHPEQKRTAAEERTISVALVASLGVAVLALVFFNWLAHEVFEGDTRVFDDRIRMAIHAHSLPALTLAMRAITHLGGPLTLIVFCAAAFFGFLIRGWRRGAAWIAVTMAGAVVLDVTLKMIYQRPRPVPFFGVAPQSYSFPSGHALGSFCFYGTLAGLIAHRSGRRAVRAAAGVVATLLIAAIGFSRLYLGVHYPTDVIAGYAAAAIWVGALVSLDRFRRRPRHRRPS